MSALGVWHLEPDFDVNCFAFGGSQLISSLRNEPISCHTTSTTGLTNSGVGYSWKQALVSNGTGDLRVDESPPEAAMN